MGAARGAVLGAVLGAGVAGACAGGSAYACESDEQCVDGGETGQCEQSGYCSFDDGTCPSGRRYGTLAPPDLAGECTAAPEEATGTSGGVITTSIDPIPDDSSSTADSAGPGGPATTPVDSVSSSESTSAEPATASTNGEQTDSSTTGPAEPTCAVSMSDDFEDELLDPAWETWASASCSYNESDGRINFTVGSSPDEWISAGISNGPTPIVGGYVRAELVPFGAPLDVIGVWLTIYDDACELQIAAEANTVHGQSGGVWLDAVQVATDEPLWLQIRLDTENVAYWEFSTDGIDWTLLHSEASPCEFANVHSAIFSGGVHGQVLPITRSVESYERCDPV